MLNDSLTGLPNRFHFIELLETRLASKLRQNFAILFLGLDRFRQINGSLGYRAGDDLLRSLARRLKDCMSDGDFVGRMGGDEFAIVTERSPDLWMQTLRRPYFLVGDEWFVGASVGAAIYPVHAGSAAGLLHAAELGMTRSKQNGGDELTILDPAKISQAKGRFKLEHDLRRALTREQFQLFYQPVVNIDGTLDAMEVLLIWSHPEAGAIPPCDFIPLAEESGLIVPIGNWVLQQACLQGAAWRGAGCRSPRLSVNISGRQLERPDSVDVVASALAVNGLPPECLELELTESYVMGNLAASLDRLRQIRDLGVRITLDDFGTGYSSLNVLSGLRVDTIKIDQSFIRKLHEPEGSLPVIQGIIGMAHQLHLEVVAEGVETESELDLVRVLGCDKVQGHIYGPAMSARQAGELLARGELHPFTRTGVACQ